MEMKDKEVSFQSIREFKDAFAPNRDEELDLATMSPGEAGIAMAKESLRKLGEKLTKKMAAI